MRDGDDCLERPECEDSEDRETGGAKKARVAPTFSDDHKTMIVELESSTPKSMSTVSTRTRTQCGTTLGGKLEGQAKMCATLFKV